MVLCNRLLFHSCVVNGHLIIQVHCGESSRWTGRKCRGRYDWPDSQGHQAVLMTRPFAAVEGYPWFCTVCAELVQPEVSDPEAMTCSGRNVNDILKSITYLHIALWKFRRSRWPRGLRRRSAPLTCWDCGFESLLVKLATSRRPYVLLTRGKYFTSQRS